MNMKKYIPIVAVVVLGAVFPLVVTNGFVLQFIINMMMFAYLATSWNIIGGYAGQMALGNGVYFGVGAYVSTVLFTYEMITPWVGMIIGGAFAAVIAFALGFLTFRLNGTYFSLATVAFLHVIRLFVNTNKTILGYDTRGALGMYVPWRGGGLANIQFEGKTGYFYVIFAMLLIGLAVSSYIKKSKMGYYLAAISTNQEAASSLGVNVLEMKQKANCISAFMMAIGGAFYAQFITAVDPARVLGYDLSIQIVLYAIVGGKGTLWGPLVGACLLAPLNDILRSTLGATIPGIAFMAYGLALMLIIYYLPGGLWPFFVGKVQNWLHKSKASASGKGG